MIDMQIKNSSNIQETSSIFKCPRGHKLIYADRTKRKRKDGTTYSTPGFNCDICHRIFSTGQSWHCSCTESGFDKCVGCVAFQLYEIDNEVLLLASRDNEQQQYCYRRHAAVRNTVRLPRGLFRLLTGSTDEDGDDDNELLALANQSSVLSRGDTLEESDDDEIEVNLRED